MALIPKAKSTFNPQTDPRRSRYLSEYNTTTNPARKQAINQKWNFGSSFNPQTDPRRQNYLSQWQTSTDPARKSAIDAKWGFSKDPALSAPAPAPTPAPPLTNVPDTTTPNANMGALFPYLSGSDVTGYLNNKMYQQRLKLGGEALDKALSARGLWNSGAGIQAHSDMADRIAADEEQLARQYNQEEANRLERMMTNESQRLDGQEARTQDNYFKALDMMLRAWNPQEGFQSAQDLANLQKQFGSTVANYITAMTPRVTGGGGGGGGSAPYIPPFAASPNTTETSLAQTTANAANESNILSTVSRFLNRLF